MNTMLLLILGLVLALLALTVLDLLKTYRHVPALELKRLARHGDQVAMVFYRPVSYGMSLAALLWFVAVLALAGSALLLAHSLPGLIAFLLVVVTIWAAFLWIPGGKLTKSGIWLAKRAAPTIAWALERLHPLIARITDFVRKHRPVTIHTGLYEKSDLAELLVKQQDQPDSRIAPGEIELLMHALTFGDKLVMDVLIPKRVVVSVNAEDTIGPALMDELHKSGHSRFPVYDGKKDNVVGILYLRDLVTTKKTGKVRDIMKKRLSFVHEDFTLYQTLQAFIKTKQQLFIAVNSFEEYTGIITIEDIIEQIVGKVIMDEFDNYEDLRAVAAKAAQKDHEAHEKADAEPVEEEPTPDEQEVVK